MNQKLVLLKRTRPVEFEIHIGEIKQAHNLLLTTQDEELATHLVESFNNYDKNKKNKKSPLKGGHVSRSAFQTIAEENKKLLNDIHILVGNTSAAKIMLIAKYREKFKKEAIFEKEFKNLILTHLQKTKA